MANPTSNFGWQMPTATDLVTDLPADFEVFGQAVDTDFVGLLGGTTGQVLSKTSNADLDFTWANSGDITGVTAGTGISGGGTSGTVTVTNSMATAFTTSGDLIQATGSGTFARLGTGTNGQFLTTNGTTNSWATPSGGALTQLATGTLSGTGVTISSIPGTYIDLVLYVTAIVNATDNRGLTLRFNSDTGTNYNRGNTVANTSNLTFATDYIDGLVGMGTTNTYSIVKITIPNYAGTTHWKLLTGVGIYQNKDNVGNVNFKNYQAAWNQLSAISTLNIVSQDSSNFSGGTYTLYGAK